MSIFDANIISIYKDKGKLWLAKLPETVALLSAKLGLSDLKEVDSLTYNYVLSWFQNNTPIILKIGLDTTGLKQESFALKCFAECGAVTVLAQDNGMLLLERAVPGFSLKNYFPNREQESIKITCRVIKKLHQASIHEHHHFPHIKDWLAALDKAWDLPSVYLKKARKLRAQLLQSALPDVLLHGDLHHDNILQNDNDWLVIDPKGVIGEAAYEVAAVIRNPTPSLLSMHNMEEIIQNRLIGFANLLELPIGRILDWCFVQSVLACVWAHEDGCDTSHFEYLTRIFDTMRLNS